MEKLNYREREYLDTIKELKSKLMVSDKLISKQEAIIINLNKSLNNLADKNQVCINLKKNVNLSLLFFECIGTCG